jgi:hypothetical protein
VNELSPNLESLVRILDALDVASGGDRRAHTLVENRLHLTRGSDSEFELFIEGEMDSFGEQMSGSLFSWGNYHDLTTNRNISALVISADNRSGHSRLLAHIAYESQRILTENPEIDNESLLFGIGPFLSLIIQSQVLSVAKQMGLTGELILMEDLLIFATQRGLHHSRVLNAWRGYENSERDYYANGIAIEVKASGSRNRVHKISSIEQLLLSDEPEEEHLCVYSIGLSPDTSRSYKLITQIDNVERVLNPLLHDDFYDYLAQYCGEGYHRNLRDRYNLETGFTISPPAGMIRIDDTVDILRYSNFTTGRLPNDVEGVTYKARFSDPDISRTEVEELYSIMLGIE